MRRSGFLFAILAGCLLANLLFASRAQAQKAAAPAADRWVQAIAAFEKADAQSPPPKDAVLFVGSSTIRLWDLKASFPDLVAINRGFGGSQMADVLKYVHRIVTPYAPRQIVLYEGDNDLQAGDSPAAVAAEFDQLLTEIRKKLPDVPVLVIAVKPSPSRWKLIDKQRELNRLLAARCEADGKARLVDLGSALVGPDGQPREELFRADRLHLNDQGYAAWSAALRPLLDKP